MSYKTKNYDWNVTLTDDEIGVPVGYEIEFRRNDGNFPVLYHLSTFRENAVEGSIFYSYDGETFFDFPLGDDGTEFYQNYIMRVVVTNAMASNVFCASGTSIYRISADSTKVLEIFDLGINIENLNVSENIIYAYANQRIYSFYTKNKISFKSSINATGSNNCVVDATRNSFWQINSSNIERKDLNSGEVIYSYAISTSDIQYFLNPKNGNLVVSSGTNIYELDFYGTFSSATSSSEITSISSGDTGYLVSFNNSYVGKFESGSLNETYFDTGYSTVSNVSGNESFFYVVDSSNVIAEFNYSFVEQWSSYIDLGDSTHLKSREDDLSVTCSSNGKITCFRGGIDFKRLGVSDSEILFDFSSVNNPSNVIIRYQSIYGESNLDQSSSSFSSNSSSSSFDSSSSSSEQYSESIQSNSSNSSFSSSSSSFVLISSSSSSSESDENSSSSSSSADNSSSSSSESGENSSSSSIGLSSSSSSEGNSESSISSSSGFNCVDDSNCFSPADEFSSSLVAWYDAADSSTLTGTSSKVTGISDKSGNGYDMTSTNTINMSSINGMCAINNDLNGYMTASMAAGTLSDAFTVFSVFQRTGDSSFDAYPINRSSGSGVPAPWDYYNSTLALGNGSSFNFRSAPNIGSSTDVRMISIDAEYSGLQYNIYENGTNSGSGTNGTVMDDTATSISLFTRNDLVTSLVGKIGECLVFIGVLGDSDRQRVEGYLAWKWGIEGDLPNDHPYKLVAPCNASSSSSESGDNSSSSSSELSSSESSISSGCAFGTIDAVASSAISFDSPSPIFNLPEGDVCVNGIYDGILDIGATAVITIPNASAIFSVDDVVEVCVGTCFVSSSSSESSSSESFGYSSSSSSSAAAPSTCPSGNPEILLTVTGATGTINWAGETWTLPAQSGEQRTVCPDAYQLVNDVTTTSIGGGNIRTSINLVESWKFSQSNNLSLVRTVDLVGVNGAFNTISANEKLLAISPDGNLMRDRFVFYDGAGGTLFSTFDLGFVSTVPVATTGNYRLTNDWFGSHTDNGITYTWTRGNGW